MSIREYEPRLVWKHFDEIRKIPRCSGHEEQIRAYVLEFAKSKKMAAKTDAAGNVVISVPATPGHEKTPGIILQGHLDMVCEKNSDVEHDFAKDPIELEIDGEWLTAQGTTLGSDNGVGVAAALGIAEDPDLAHGPIELLFTVDEEVGLTGAGKLEEGFLKGRRLLNLDSEELGSFFIGCAGGGDSTINLPVKRQSGPAGTAAVLVKVSGLRGGHSGLDIIEQRGNAIKILVRVLWTAEKSFDVSLVDIAGGNKRNAIPREAQAHALVRQDQLSRFTQLAAGMQDVLKEELGGREPAMKIVVEQGGASNTMVMERASQQNLLNLLLAIPFGVEAMNYDIPGLVDTSNNLATVSTSEKEVEIGTSTRSSIPTALQALRDRIRAAAELAGASVREETPYPGWKPNVESELLKIAKGVHEKVLGREPEIKAIHAGLECGIIGEKYSGMDMISFGPHIEHPHSPDERINIPSVQTFWKLLRGFVEALA